MKTKSMQSILFLLWFGLSLVSFGQTEIETKPVHFKSGTSSAEVSDVLKGYQNIDYTLGAKAGQEMTVHLITDNTANYFNVLPSDSEEAIFVGSVNGNSWTGILPKTDTYRVRVYLMRSAARRNEKANYSLNFAISSKVYDVKVSGTNYHATGMVPCSVGPDPKHSAQCKFGVVRTGKHSAEVHLSTPGGEQRIIMFRGDEVFCEDPDVDLTSEKEGDTWEVSVNNFEFFSIPEAVITGG